MLVAYPTLIAPLFNKFSPARGRDAPGPDRAPARQVRIPVEGPVRHGRLEALEPRQRLLHRLRRGEAHRVLRHAALAARAGGGRGGARARARPLQAPSRLEAGRVALPREPRVPGAPRLSHRRALVLRGARRRRGGAPRSRSSLFFMVVPVFTFLLAPIGSVYSRKHEYEADAYAARHASGDGLVHALVKLYQDNAATLTPDPVHSAFYDSHPPAALRIARLQALAPLKGRPARSRPGRGRVRPPVPGRSRRRRARARACRAASRPRTPAATACSSTRTSPRRGRDRSGRSALDALLPRRAAPAEADRRQRDPGRGNHRR